MELLLLGTAAAEGWPTPYCDCVACAEARRRGGPNIRSRTGALIDEDLKIDHGPDTVIHMQRAGKSLAQVRTILFTHQHDDHFYAADLKRASAPSSTTRPAGPIAVYANQHILAAIRQEFSDPAKWSLDLHQLEPLKRFTTSAGDTVLPIPCIHCEDSYIFRITRRGKHLLYGHDTGPFSKAMYDALNDGVVLDVALLECTHGPKTFESKTHLTLGGVWDVVSELRRQGAATDRTRLIVTHFSHNGGMLHEELVRTFLPHGIEVAYDGMRVLI
jgi:phosphoribosyl 1,2-cyclic phosphate phosphodiesterase